MTSPYLGVSPSSLHPQVQNKDKQEAVVGPSEIKDGVNKDAFALQVMTPAY